MSVLFYGCKNDDSYPVDGQGKDGKDFSPQILSDITVNAAHFQVTLLDGYPKKTGDNYEWRWKIVNPNPSSTHKNLGHWDITLGNCAAIGNVVSAAYSTNQINWYSFTPALQLDPTTSCCNEVGQTLKFPVGTSGSDPTYYSLVVNRNYQVDNQVKMILKYGTDCSIHYFPGLGCDNNVLCFSDPTLAWGGNRSFLLTSYQYLRYVTNSLGISTVYNLATSGGTIVGTITITDNGQTVSVKFKSAAGWYFSRTYLDYACSNSGLHAYAGVPLLTSFDLHQIHSPYVQEYTYTFDNPHCSCDAIYLMAYVYVAQTVDC